jgi:hypothetical protein
MLKKIENKLKEKGWLFYIGFLGLKFGVICTWMSFALHGFVLTLNAWFNEDFGQAFLWGTALNRIGGVALVLLPLIFTLIGSLGRKNKFVYITSLVIATICALFKFVIGAPAMVAMVGIIFGLFGLDNVKSLITFGTSLNLILGVVLLIVDRIVKKFIDGIKKQSKKQKSKEINAQNWAEEYRKSWGDIPEDIKNMRILMCSAMLMFDHVDGLNMKNRKEYYSFAYLVNQHWKKSPTALIEKIEQWGLMARNNHRCYLIDTIVRETMAFVSVDEKIPEDIRCELKRKSEAIIWAKDYMKGHFGILDKTYAPDWAIEFEPIFYDDVYITLNNIM